MGFTLIPKDNNNSDNEDKNNSSNANNNSSSKINYVQFISENSLINDSGSDGKNEIPKILVPNSVSKLTSIDVENMIDPFEGSPYQNVEK